MQFFANGLTMMMTIKDSGKILAVFDFDHTLIELNTDAEVQKSSTRGAFVAVVHEME